MFFKTLPISHSLSFKCLATPFFHDPSYEKKNPLKNLPLLHPFVSNAWLSSCLFLVAVAFGCQPCTEVTFRLVARGLHGSLPIFHHVILENSSPSWFPVTLRIILLFCFLPSLFLSLDFLCLCLFLVGPDGRTPGLVHVRQELSCYQARIVTNFPSAS